jgi:hypothetical protein
MICLDRASGVDDARHTRWEVIKKGAGGKETVKASAAGAIRNGVRAGYCRYRILVPPDVSEAVGVHNFLQAVPSDVAGVASRGDNARRVPTIKLAKDNVKITAHQKSTRRGEKGRKEIKESCSFVWLCRAIDADEADRELIETKIYS